MQTKHYPVAFLLVAFVAVSSFYLNTLITPAAPTDPQKVAAEVSTERYMNNLTHLAAPR